MKEKITKALRKEFFERFAALVTGAFTFVAALAWNDAIQSLIKKYISSGSTLKSQIIYALLVTLIAILAIIQINVVAKALEKTDDNLEKSDNKEEK